MWIFLLLEHLYPRVYVACVSQIKMNDSYENRNWQAKNVVLCRRHIILDDLMPSFGCISCTTLEASAIFDGRLFSFCFSLFLFYFNFIQLRVCHGWSCHNSKISFLPKRMHSVMRKDTDEIYEAYEQKIKTKQNNQTNRQQKRRQHTNKSEAKINGFKLNIFIRSSTEKYDTVNRMRFTFRVQLVIFRSSHRIGGSTAHTIGHSNWKITLFHRVFKLNDIHINILIWR